jgi:hypothetical protein
MPRLQIGLELNTDNNPNTYEVRVTPADFEVPEDVAKAAETIQNFFDSFDANPGDGEADVPVKERIPIRLAFLKTNINIDGNVFLRVKR